MQKEAQVGSTSKVGPTWPGGSPTAFVRLQSSTHGPLTQMVSVYTIFV